MNNKCVSLSLALSAAALIWSAPANAQSYQPRGALANAPNACQLFNHAAWFNIEFTATAVRNILPTTNMTGIMVSCGQAADEFARNGAVTLFGIYITNRNATPRTIQCVGTHGPNPSDRSIMKPILVPANTQEVVIFDYVQDNAGVPFNKPTTITCSIPGQVELNDSVAFFESDVSDNPPVSTKR